MLIKIFLIFLVLFVLIDCRHPILYEISTRPWLYELSRKYEKPISKLKDIPLEEFDNLKENGIDIIWMMGVWKLGEYGLEFDKKLNYSKVFPSWTKEDVIGSPYAIVEYTCNPEIGTNEDLIWLRKQINSRDMKLMLDFVPNHSAIDAPEAKANPKLYIRAPKGVKNPNRYTGSGFAFGSYPNHAPWKDVIQWNYWEEETRKLMKKNLMTVLSYADGVRCDVAGLILNDVIERGWRKELNYWGYKRPNNEFWEYAFTEVKLKYPNAILLAEAYDKKEIEALYKLGFNYCYNKDLLNKLMDSSSSELKNYLKNKTEKDWGHLATFVENHDEDRIVYNMGNIDKAKTAGALAATLGGMIFINHGQWSGYRNKLEVHLRKGENELENYEIKTFYEKLMQIIQDPAFTSSNYYYINNIKGVKKDDYIAYIREEGESHYLVVVNYSDSYGCGDVPIYNIEENLDVSLREVLHDVEYIRNGYYARNKGLIVCLNPWETQIFKYNY